MYLLRNTADVISVKGFNTQLWNNTTQQPKAFILEQKWLNTWWVTHWNYSDLLVNKWNTGPSHVDIYDIVLHEYTYM